MVTKKSIAMPAFTLCLLFIAIFCAAGAAAPQDLPPLTLTTSVAEALDGATLALADGQSLRLAGLTPPMKAKTHKDFVCAAAETAALDKITAGQTIRIRLEHAAPDWAEHVHGTALGPDGGSIALDLLKAGFARSYSFAGEEDIAADALAGEADARAHGRGLWSPDSGCYRILTMNDLTKGRTPEGFAIVEGRIFKAADTSGGLYLDFGANWKQDFSAFIESTSLPAFRKARLYPDEWEGRSIRVRGWLFWRSGPMMLVTLPSQIELLPDLAPSSADAAPHTRN